MPRQAFVSILASLLITTAASAISITPTYQDFGPLPSATFGGTGIPNHSVAVTKIQDGSRSITLGLTAHQRYSNPALADDGAGTFWGLEGGDIYSGTNSNPAYARWNLGLYVDFDANISMFASNPYTVSLYFDKDPAIGNDVTTYTNLSLYLLGKNPLFSYDGQGSENLSMTSLFGAGFDPAASGEYGFALVLSKNGQELGRSAIVVNVNSTGSAPVPEGGSVGILLGLALLGLTCRTRH